MLYKKAKTIEPGRFEVKYNEIYRNPDLVVFSNEGADYVVEASLFRDVKSEKRFRLNLKGFLVNDKPFLYIIEKADAEKINLAQIREERTIRDVLFKEARRKKTIEFLSVMNHFSNIPKPKPRAPGFENRDIICLRDYSSYWV